MADDKNIRHYKVQYPYSICNTMGNVYKESRHSQLIPSVSKKVDTFE